MVTPAGVVISFLTCCFCYILFFSLCRFIFLLCLYIMPFNRPPRHNIPSSN